MSIPDLLNCEFTDFKTKCHDFSTTDIILSILTNVDSKRLFLNSLLFYVFIYHLSPVSRLPLLCSKVLLSLLLLIY